MNPLTIWRIIAGIAALVGIGGTAYGVDQHQKRKTEQAAYRQRLQQLEVELADKEAQLASLVVILGEKNEQVRHLAAKVVSLRAELSSMRMSA